MISVHNRLLYDYYSPSFINRSIIIFKAIPRILADSLYFDTIKILLLLILIIISDV